MSDHRTVSDVWAAMQRSRRCHYLVRPLNSPGLLAMLSIWTKVDSPLMQEWSTEIAEFAADLFVHLEDELWDGGWDLEREILPTILSFLTWTDEGVFREGEPQDFMADVIATLKEGSVALAPIY